MSSASGRKAHTARTARSQPCSRISPSQPASRPAAVAATGRAAGGASRLVTTAPSGAVADREEVDRLVEPLGGQPEVAGVDVLRAGARRGAVAAQPPVVEALAQAPRDEEAELERVARQHPRELA